MYYIRFVDYAVWIKKGVSEKKQQLNHMNKLEHIMMVLVLSIWKFNIYSFSIQQAHIF